MTAVLEAGSPQWLLALAFALLGGVFVVALKRYLRGKAVWRYDPKAAWLRAFAYFSFAWAFAAASGTIDTLARNPLVFEDQWDDAVWVISTVVVFAVIIVGYWIVWPIGTQAHGRKIVIPDTVVFGVCWGVSEGLVYGSVWLLAHRALDDLWAGPVWVALVVIIVMSIFSGVGHATYWDVHVSPEHNIIDWNMRKVALVHNPNLVLCTIYVTWGENLGIYVMLEALALLGSTLFMPFPTFRRPLPPDPLSPALGPPTDVPADMTGKTVVLTGAAGGIGSVAARALAGQGASLVLIDLAGDAGPALAHELGVDFLAADLSSVDDTHRLAVELLERYPRIDVLINNAGVFMPRYSENDAGIEMTLAVNHLGAFQLTDLLRDRLVQSAARVLFVSSDAHRQAKPIDWDDMNCTRAWDGRDVDSSAAFQGYNQAKLAVTATAMELADRTADTGMTVNVLTPGPMVMTGMFAELTGWFSWLVKAMGPFWRSTEKAASIHVYLATSPEVEGVTGWYWKDNRPIRESAVAQDPELRARLWDWSVSAVESSPTGA
jgi:NAD(P)-dependent dehydrogenase (short-subunit alcohol dehydrogenase family)